MFPKQLTDGYHAFLDDSFPREQQRFEDLAQSGQKPEVMIIGCCDSRVSPEVIFNARPGEMFVARNVANLVPPYEPENELEGTHHGTSAALEFAVQALRVQHIVVLGHARCGGVRAFADDTTEPLSPGDFIGRWIRLLVPAAERSGGRGVHETLTVYVERLALAWDVPVRLVHGEAAKHGAFRRARAALAASGTVTLELALAGVPMVVAYKVSRIEEVIARRLIQVPTIVLPNLILAENAMPEYVQADCTPQRLADTLAPLVTGEPERTEHRRGNRAAGQSEKLAAIEAHDLERFVLMIHDVPPNIRGAGTGTVPGARIPGEIHPTGAARAGDQRFDKPQSMATGRIHPKFISRD